MVQDDDKEIEEVKAVLQKLQSIGKNNSSDSSAENSTFHNEAFSTQSNTETKKYNSKGVTSRIILIGSVIAVLCASAVIVRIMLLGPQESNLTADSKFGYSESKNSLTKALELLEGGKIEVAREMLLKKAEAGDHDAAFALARSYDPNVLKKIPSANAYADIPQAKYWYRQWHDIASKKGLVVTDSNRLERLIRSMR